MSGKNVFGVVFSRRLPALRNFFVAGVVLAAIICAMVPTAKAQCGLPTKPIKPAVWQPQDDRAHLKLASAKQDDDQPEPSITGMWHVIFTAQTINGEPFSGVIDNAVVVWHSDHTEIMNSARPAQDGNFCLGVWVRTGKLTYYLNHIPWQGNDPTNAPSGIGNPQGGAQLTEKITLNPDGDSYSGSFTLTAYDPSGHVTVTFTGMLAAKRVTVHTAFTDLL